jgi:DNA repair protein RecO (recombination protein O)
MLLKTRGIVFRTHKYGESSLIVEMYTEQRGLRKYIISGVRSAKARTKASLLQVMTLLDIVAYERDDRDLNRLKELQPAFIYMSIPFDVRKGAVGLFMVEVARKAIREREENEALFNFLFDRFAKLDQSSNSIANYHLAFLLELSAYLGFAPAGEYSDETPIFDLQDGEFVARPPDHSQYLIDEVALAFYELLHYPAPRAHELKLERAVRQRLLSELIRYFQLHLEGMGEVNAHLILREVF